MFGLEKIADKIERPPAGVGADIAIPCFRADPAAMADRVRALKNPLFQSVEVKGRYVNVAFDVGALARHAIDEALSAGDGYGANADHAGARIMVEYSAPNIAKPMHMGHARNNAIGHALVRILHANGYAVVTTNHLGDWGMSLAKIMLAYRKWGDRAAFERDPIRTLLDLYVRVTAETKTNPALDGEAKALFKKLEGGDAAVRALWQELRDVSVANFKRVYAMLGIDFDIWNGESSYEEHIKPAIEEALRKGVAAYGEPEEEGASRPVVVNLDSCQLPSFLLAKSDGASLYSARDIAVGKWRLERYPDAEKIIYVVGHEQELYLRQIFKTLGLMGYPEEKFEHVSYGVVTLNGKKISTREGGIVFLEDGLKEAIEKAKGVREVGIGAVVYNMLCQGREHDIAFSWDAALNLEGNSAPYIQYAYVRAKAILQKAASEGAADPERLTAPVEINVIKTLAWYPHAVREACRHRAPHIIATYANTLAQEFNRFYAESPVLTGDAAARPARLALTSAAAQTLKNSLGLLGIQVPERM